MNKSLKFGFICILLLVTFVYSEQTNDEEHHEEEERKDDTVAYENALLNSSIVSQDTPTNQPIFLKVCFQTPFFKHLLLFEFF